MRRASAISGMISAVSLLAAMTAVPAGARDAVDAAAPSDLSVTIYRDPNRREGQAMNTRWPRGFAMISEVREVTLPPGESTIRFEGVAEGMVAVSAIVTGLPGGTIEKNRNADLLSPGALVDGTLGNRVTITRTNPANGKERAESAIVRTRADGGLVLQTEGGFEAVRCSGLPEKLTFDRIPAGLSAKPVYSINTRDATGGTYQITLTYLAWGFDWQAHYVATLGPRTGEAGAAGKQKINLLSWLTVLNDNNQSFDNANLMAVAGTLNIESNFQGLATPPVGKPLRLMCYPLGSTADGTPVRNLILPPPPPSPNLAPVGMMADAIMVTGARMKGSLQEAPVAVTAVEEELGDLKLYRVPERMSVASKGLKQVAFLQRDDVKAEFLYTGTCLTWDEEDDPTAATRLLITENKKAFGLGVALPMGGITIFEPSPAGDLLVGEENLRDYAVGQDVEIALGTSTQVFDHCKRLSTGDRQENQGKWLKMQSTVTNANSAPVKIRLDLGWSNEWRVRKGRGLRVKDGQHVIEATIPAGGERVLKWEIRATDDG